MHYAHERGLVHRDLKPANILLSRISGQFLPKITDFGIVKVLGDHSSPEHTPRTRTGIAMGTPSYMAPEQVINSKDVGPTADVFSLGCILHEMLCGQMTFDGSNVYAIIDKTRAGEYADPREVVPGLPERFYEVITRSLEPDETQRIQSCTEFEQILFGEAAVLARSNERLPPVPSPPPAAETLAPDSLLESSPTFSFDADADSNTTAVSTTSRPVWRVVVLFGALLMLLLISGLVMAAGGIGFLAANWASTEVKVPLAPSPTTKTKPEETASSSAAEIDEAEAPDPTIPVVKKPVASAKSVVKKPDPIRTLEDVALQAPTKLPTNTKGTQPSTAFKSTDRIRARIVKWRTQQSLSDGGAFSHTAAAGNRLLLIDFEFQSVGVGRVSAADPVQFFTSKSQQVAPHGMCQLAAGNAEYRLLDIESGASTLATYCFEVPKSQSNYRLRLLPSNSKSKGVWWDWRVP